MYLQGIEDHLIQNLLPFWRDLYDPLNGGFYGYMDQNYKVFQQSDKGCILTSRILWFFSNSYQILKNEKDLKCAKHA